jgi:hypothetical protein
MANPREADGANRRSSRKYTITDCGGAPDLSVFEDHEADIDVSLILFELKWGTVNSLVQQIGAHGGIDCCRQSRACQRTFGTAECGGR